MLMGDDDDMEKKAVCLDRTLEWSEDVGDMCDHCCESWVCWFEGISEILGFVHMMRKFHTQDWGRIIDRVDASACLAIILRRGCGRLKHITIKSFQVQGKSPARCEACVHTCFSIQCGRTEALERVEWFPK